MTGPELEPIGHLKFGAAADKPLVKNITTLAGWRGRAKDEFAVHHYAVPILNATDDELEQLMRSGDTVEENLDAFLELAEHCQDWASRYKAGIEVLDAVSARILVVASRLADELAQKGGAS